MTAGSAGQSPERPVRPAKWQQLKIISPSKPVAPGAPPLPAAIGQETKTDGGYRGTVIVVEYRTLRILPETMTTKTMPKKNRQPFSRCPCVGATLDRLVQPAILAVLAAGPLHGYELARKIGDIPAFLNDAPDISGVYRNLKNLEARGLVVAEWDTTEACRAKRVYTITEQGRHCLQTWNETLRNYRQAVDSLLKATEEAIKHR